MSNYTTPNLPQVVLTNNAPWLAAGIPLAIIQQNPAELSASENTIPFIFYNSQIGNFPPTRLTLIVNGSWGTTGNITLTSGVVSITLTPAQFPSTNQFYNANGSITAIQRARVAESIAYELRSNSLFSAYYNVYAQSATIFIEAREKGAKYNFDTSILNAGIAGSSTASQVAGNDVYDFQSLIDPEYFVEIYAGQAGKVIGEQLDKRLSELADIYTIPARLVDTWAIDVSSSIKPFTDLVQPTKINTPSVVVKMLDKQTDKLPIVRPYFIVWGISKRFLSGGEKKKSVTGCSTIKYALNGAFGLLEEYDLSPNILDTTSTQSVKFMTSSPTNKLVDYNSHEYLHFYRKKNSAELGVFGIEVVYTYTDGSTETKSYPLGNYAGIDGTCSVDISPNVLDIRGVETISGLTVATYEVKLYWTISSLARFYSEPRTFEMVRVCASQTNNIIFSNEYGVWESLNFTGEAETAVERDVEYMKRPIGISRGTFGFNDVSDEIFVTMNLSVTNQRRLTTNLVDNATYKWLTKLFASTAMYIYDQADRAYRAIRLVDYSYSYSTDADANLFSITIAPTTEENYITR